MQVKHLGNVPYRLAYYLNYGFTLDPRSEALLPFMFFERMAGQLDQTHFKSVLMDYNNEAWKPVDIRGDLAMGPFERCVILDHLQGIATNWALPSADRLFQVAESSSSDASQRIMDNLRYSTRHDTAAFKTAGNLLYLMHLDVTRWDEARAERRAQVASRIETVTWNPSALATFLNEIVAAKTALLDSENESAFGKGNCAAKVSPLKRSATGIVDLSRSSKRECIWG